MTLNSDSVIELCADETDLPSWSFDFKKLKDLIQVEPASIIGKWSLVMSCLALSAGLRICCVSLCR